VLAALDSTALRVLDDAGSALGPAQQIVDLPAQVAALEGSDGPRWIWSSTAASYPTLLRAGVRVRRCHDLGLTDALLAGHNGTWSPPASHDDYQHDDVLFDLAAGSVAPADVRAPAERYLAQQTAIRVARGASPGFALLVAAESGASLAAAEMTYAGLPWRADVHDRLLEGLLGQRPRYGGRPPRLAELAAGIVDALDDPALNPDSPEQVLRALRRQGLTVTTTRSRELEQVDHPAVPLLLEYKELARLHSAHGWAWLEQWVHDGRFHPEYGVGGVVSGRWASRGGGALQIPRAVRVAVVADPGWRLVVADARQLEPRVLAAMSGDPDLARVALDDDLYAGLAAQSFGGDRAAAKVGLLSAMYGGASPALSVLQRAYPQALALLERAARSGERGESVRSVLGRTSPRADLTGASEEATVARERGWGRFTRNFVVQASAADWANVLLSVLRGRLAEVPDAELVFFQHDEVVLHVPAEAAEASADAVRASAAEATNLVFGATPVAMPLAVAVVDAYSDAK